MALQLINNTDANTCSTDAFLDSLISIEHVDESSPRSPPSPVFGTPSEPNPHFVFYHPFAIWNSYIIDEMQLYCKVMYIPGIHICEYYHYSQKTNFKNQNKHFRKMGRLKQPGGSSCDQRR